MKTRKSSNAVKPLVAAIIGAVKGKPVLPVLTDKQKNVLGERLDAFVVALLCWRVTDKEAASAGASAFARYVEVSAAGVSAKDISAHAMSAAENEADNPVDIPAERNAASTKCAQYGKRVALLVAEGVPLVDANGSMVPCVVLPVRFQSKETGAQNVALSTLAKLLQDEASKAAGTKGTKARKGAKDADSASDGKITHEELGIIPFDVSTVPVTAELCTRIGAALAMSGSDSLRAALVATCPDALLEMAQTVARNRIIANGEAAARAQSKKIAEIETADRLKLATAQNALDLRADALSKAKASRNRSIAKGKRAVGKVSKELRTLSA